MAFRNQIIGLIRFSYPALNGFTQGSDDVAADRARLFSEDRLSARFRLFEALTLPSLRAQTDADYRLGVLVGEGLPPSARDRLEAALSDLPDAHVVSLPPMKHYQATQAAFAQLTDDRTTHLTSFRLDDDDAVDRRLIARLRGLADGLTAMAGRDRIVTIAFNRGFFLELDPAGNRVFDVTEKLPLGIGLAMTAPVASHENIFRRNHRLLPQFFTTYSDADTPAFIRTVHPGNDSDAHLTGTRDTMPPARIAREISRAFPFSLDDLLAL